MKVVINNCYGGFSLSPAAVKWIAEKQGKPCYFYKSEFDKESGETIYVPVLDGFEAGLFWVASTESDPAKVSYSENVIDNRDICRHDPLLVQAVKKLKAKANGSCAKLKIVDIPDDVEYIIQEYDGIEWIAEKHRTWN